MGLIKRGLDHIGAGLIKKDSFEGVDLEVIKRGLDSVGSGLVKKGFDTVGMGLIKRGLDHIGAGLIKKDRSDGLDTVGMGLIKKGLDHLGSGLIKRGIDTVGMGLIKRGWIKSARASSKTTKMGHRPAKTPTRKFKSKARGLTKSDQDLLKKVKRKWILLRLRRILTRVRKRRGPWTMLVWDSLNAKLRRKARMQAGTCTDIQSCRLSSKSFTQPRTVCFEHKRGRHTRLSLCTGQATLP
ncbi:hypothetical protein C0Q70_21068 [Pomacea canaliculata]|uniref:Uncharacterized protein n=1 Tax=Pomacea canaliculata TaxID=400727 RepID=A0A2T7NBI5_POMCA|nr:hypothetical protein C0Q70_21068 [Pomacea canaliculata]